MIAGLALLALLLAGVGLFGRSVFVHHHQARLSADLVFPAGSKPAPDFSLRDQNGSLTSLKSLRGQVLAITFLDTHCTQLCPLIAGQLAAADRDLGKSPPFQMVVVSIAPQSDTPSSAVAFANKYQWSSNWHWLLGSPAAVAAVWKEYGIYVAGTSPNLAHSTGLFLVDRDGFERALFVASADPNQLARDIQGLATED